MKLLMLAVVLVGVIAVSGCDKAKNFVEGDVAKVQNGTLEFDKSLTVGQAVDKYKYFKSTKWEAVKTDNGRRMVNVIGDIDVARRYPGEEASKTKSAYIKFQFVINQDNTFHLQWCGAGVELKDGTKTEPEESVFLPQCINALKEIYNNEPKEIKAAEKAIAQPVTSNEAPSPAHIDVQNQKPINMQQDIPSNNQGGLGRQ